MKHCVFFILLLCTALVRADVSVQTGKNTGLRTWKWTHNGISLTLVQRLPDQTRAYAQSRGFSADQSSQLATACFFGSMFRNDGDQPMDFDLDQWRIVYDGKASHMATREYWAARFSEQVISTAARVGLKWSLMPTRQHFEAGDYNWGMTAYGLPPGSVFDLYLRLHIAGKPVDAIIPGLQCSPEVIEKP